MMWRSRSSIVTSLGISVTVIASLHIEGAHAGSNSDTQVCDGSASTFSGTSLLQSNRLTSSPRSHARRAAVAEGPEFRLVLHGSTGSFLRQNAQVFVMVPMAVCFVISGVLIALVCWIGQGLHAEDSHAVESLSVSSKSLSTDDTQSAAGIMPAARDRGDADRRAAKSASASRETKAANVRGAPSKRSMAAPPAALGAVAAGKQELMAKDVDAQDCSSCAVDEATGSLTEKGKRQGSKVTVGEAHDAQIHDAQVGHPSGILRAGDAAAFSERGVEAHTLIAAKTDSGGAQKNGNATAAWSGVGAEAMSCSAPAGNDNTSEKIVKLTSVKTGHSRAEIKAKSATVMNVAKKRVEKANKAQGIVRHGSAVC